MALADSLQGTKFTGSPQEYATDRYTKALEILDLMTEKLPVEQSPYSILIGEQIGNLYAQLGLILDNEEALDKGLEIMLGEIKRYAPYIPYLADLQRRGLYNSLTRSDKYSTSYLTSLIESYYAAGGDIELVEDILTAQGVDLKSLFVTDNTVPTGEGGL